MNINGLMSIIMRIFLCKIWQLVSKFRVRFSKLVTFNQDLWFTIYGHGKDEVICSHMRHHKDRPKDEMKLCMDLACDNYKGRSIMRYVTGQPA